MKALEAYEQVVRQMGQVHRLMTENLPATQSANPIISAEATRIQRDMFETFKRLEVLANKILVDAGVEVDE